jgi:hypothetical protein
MFPHHNQRSSSSGNKNSSKSHATGLSYGYTPDYSFDINPAGHQQQNHYFSPEDYMMPAMNSQRPSIIIQHQQHMQQFAQAAPHYRIPPPPPPPSSNTMPSSYSSPVPSFSNNTTFSLGAQSQAPKQQQRVKPKINEVHPLPAPPINDSSSSSLSSIAREVAEVLAEHAYNENKANQAAEATIPVVAPKCHLHTKYKNECRMCKRHKESLSSTAASASTSTASGSNSSPDTAPASYHADQAQHSSHSSALSSSAASSSATPATSSFDHHHHKFSNNNVFENASFQISQMVRSMMRFLLFLF